MAKTVLPHDAKDREELLNETKTELAKALREVHRLKVLMDCQHRFIKSVAGIARDGNFFTTSARRRVSKIRKAYTHYLKDAEATVRFLCVS